MVSGMMERLVSGKIFVQCKIFLFPSRILTTLLATSSYTLCVLLLKFDAGFKSNSFENLAGKAGV